MKSGAKHRGADGPLARYCGLIESGKLVADDAQRRVAGELQRSYNELVHKRGGWFRRAPRVEGVYIHGGVGRGKTLLMDLFVAALQQAGIQVERAHFHRFMDGVHTQLKSHRQHEDPLARIGMALRKRARVMCFDEFHVEDIADAMILGELTRHWFDQDMTLVTTSNQAPHGLYAGGLQRRRFEPAIENIEGHCRVVALEAATDFRLRELECHPTWYTPCGDETERGLEAEFRALSADQPRLPGPLKIRGRKLPIRCRSGSLLWADFDQLCEGPRSAADYIELAYRFSTLFISNIPQMNDDRNNAARRFVHLIDECYDRSVKVIASSGVAIEQLYQGKKLAGPFQRTVSRLVEMQSQEYLARPHQ